MLELIHNLHLSMIFIIGILMLVLIGILSAELSKKRGQKKDLFWLMFLCLVFLARNFVEGYAFLKTSTGLVFDKIGLIFNFIPLIIIIIVFWVLWRKLNKKIISFMIIYLIGIFSTNFLLLILENIILKIINLISIMLLNLGVYLLIVKYLIDID